MKKLLALEAVLSGTMALLCGKKVGLKMGLCLIGLNFFLGGVNL